MASSSNRSTSIDYQRDKYKLEALSELLSYKLDDIFAEFGVNVKPNGKRLVGRCPIHGGDKHNAFNIFPDGHSIRGNWVCLTHHCEKKFCPTVLGFVRGLLSAKNGWTEEQGTKGMYSFFNTVHWACNFVGKKWHEISPGSTTAERHKFISMANALNKKVETPEDGWTRAYTRERLIIPSPYYLSRGFSREVLERFDIGDSKVEDPTHPMYKRAVVPIYNNNASRVVGVAARAIEKGVEPRWRNSYGFNCERHLFNYWNALPIVKRTGKIIVVEGPGDALKLVEAGYENVVALFGSSLTDSQQILIECSGAMTATLLLDKDGAGQQAKKNIIEQLGRFMNFVVPEIGENKDVGEMSVDDVKQLLTKARA